MSWVCYRVKDRFKSEIYINRAQRSVKACHFHFAKNVWKRIKEKFNLTDPIEIRTYIRRQIVNIISLSMVPPDELNHCMERIVDELLKMNTKFNKLTDDIVNNYIDNARFPVDIWNPFDLFGQQPLRGISS